MSDEERRADRHPTDEPDGTPAHQASLRRPGESVTGGAAEPEVTEDAGFADRGGYDADAVSGDSAAYRPD
ncbi:hypothetical protein [Actinoplanes sp. CA-252034]|uniref:hypothetical protein n=1 Tax=Actinoplanes sp. CA-252034 TaxID=3239906 RepID=UPI003D9901DD